MRECLRFYIDGAWVEPARPGTLDVTNPANGMLAGRVSRGTAADVDRAVRAARNAFGAWSVTSRDERIDALERVIAEYRCRSDEIADAITEEMGAPVTLSRRAQAPSGLTHLEAALAVLKTYHFEESRGTTRIIKEPIGVCGLITPWNWPMNQIACKVAPALATGCTIVLKPSEISPFSAALFAQVLHAARIPAGVFNLVNGEGAEVGGAIASHPGVDMVSITGSTRAGVAVTSGVKHAMGNAGQSCNAATRMLVPADKLDRVISIAKQVAEGIRVGDPNSGAEMGPVASLSQWKKIQELIASGIEERASLVTGGLGRPEGLEMGCYVKPTIFAGVTNDMRIAKEEIFGPVLSIISYNSVDEAVQIANGTEYGLAAYVWGTDMARINKIASQLRAGRVCINGASGDPLAPFGGYKMSGNGREWGEYGFNEFLEVKAVLGCALAAG